MPATKNTISEMIVRHFETIALIHLRSDSFCIWFSRHILFTDLYRKASSIEFLESDDSLYISYGNFSVQEKCRRRSTMAKLNYSITFISQHVKKIRLT